MQGVTDLFPTCAIGILPQEIADVKQQTLETESVNSDGNGRAWGLF
jgi:hypothetical protein